MQLCLCLRSCIRRCAMAARGAQAGGCAARGRGREPEDAGRGLGSCDAGVVSPILRLLSAWVAARTGGRWSVTVHVSVANKRAARREAATFCSQMIIIGARAAKKAHSA